MVNEAFSTTGFQAASVIFAWWAIAQVLGWLALPLCMRVFAWLPDRGYTASKAVGLMLASYLLWLGASTGLIANTPAGALTAVLLVGVISVLVAYLGKAGFASLGAFLRERRRLVISAELLFLAAFVAWAMVRAYAPDKIMSSGGEKWMEIAFLNGVLASPTFPPQDPWLSGFAISYYYFGYVMMGLVTNLSGVPAAVGFELYDALLYALAAVGSYGVAYNLIQSRDDKPVPSAHGFAFLAPFLLLVMSNLEGMLESLHSAGLLPAGVAGWLNIPDLANAPVTNSFNPGLSNGWWWWRASRILQEFYLTGEPHGLSPITEFPFFSFLLGDNHPHVLGLPFVVLAIAFALNLFLSARHFTALPGDEKPSSEGALAFLNPVSTLAGDWLLFLFGSFLLGGLAFLNTWDFPIYLGLCVTAYLAGRIGSGETFGAAIKPAAILAAGWLVPAVGLYLFFYLSFSSQAGGILPYVFPPTRMLQYFVMFGAFLFIAGAFLLALLLEHGPELRRSALRGWGLMAALGASLIILIVLMVALSGPLSQAMGIEGAQITNGLNGLPTGEAAMRILLNRLSDPWLFILLSALIGLAFGAVFMARTSDPRLPFPAKFTLLLIALGFGLTWVPEFIYLRDYFGVRMNTVFKFYFQAWVMFSIAGAYALWWLAGIKGIPAILRSILLGVVVFPAALGLVYPALAIPSRTAAFSGTPDLDGANSLARYYGDDFSLIAWLQANGRSAGEPAPVILEAPGLSYNYEGRVSAFTGFPTVLGWSLHEGQWRGSYVEQDLRKPDVETIYTSSDPFLTLELLDKWQVRYVVLSGTERTYIQNVCAENGRACNPSASQRKFDQILTPVFNQGSATLYAVP